MPHISYYIHASLSGPQTTVPVFNATGLTFNLQQVIKISLTAVKLQIYLMKSDSDLIADLVADNPVRLRCKSCLTLNIVRGTDRNGRLVPHRNPMRAVITQVMPVKDLRNSCFCAT